MQMVRTHKNEENKESLRSREAKIIADNLLKSSGLPTTEEQEELDNDEIEEMEEGQEVDIFDYAHQVMQKGDAPVFVIFKNNKFLATKEYPYSWNELQKEFGEGHYKIQLKSEITKNYIKQKSLLVAGTPNKSNFEAEKQGRMQEVKQFEQPKADPFEGVIKTVTLMKELQGDSKNEMMQMQLRQTEMMMNFMQSLTQLSSKMQENMQMMVKEMNQQTQETIKEIQKDSRSQMEKLENRLTLLSQEPKKSMGPDVLLKMVLDAESRGEQRYKLLDSLASRKAAELAARGDTGEKEPKSTTDKLIEGLLPVVATAMANKAQQAPIQRQRNFPLRPAQVPPSAMVRPAPVPGTGINPNGQQGNPLNPVNRDALPVIGGAKKTTPITFPTKKEEPKTAQVVEENKEDYLEIVLPIVGKGLMNASEAGNTLDNTTAIAKESILAIEEKGKSVKILLNLVKKEDMMAMARQFNLPSEADSWLNKYYADLESLHGRSSQN